MAAINKSIQLSLYAYHALLELGPVKLTTPQAISVTIAFIFFFIAVYVYIRKNHAPKYVPESEKKNSRFNLRSLLRLKPKSPSNQNIDQETSYAPSASTTQASHSLADLNATSDVNRNTSIRSIMTLPAYRPSPNPDERLIAREGERAGVDTVIEFPETADEEEARREEDMEALYQIRQARRQETAESADRRRARQEAREQGDWARLEQLRLQSQRRARARTGESNHSAASSTTSLTPAAASTTLIAEHAARTSSRDGRISSVSYADLGLARHDGSRLRADSADSDNRPLLDSAASMGGGGATPRRGSLFHTHIFHDHDRANSVDSATSADFDLTPQVSSNSQPSDTAIRTPSASEPSQPSPPSINQPTPPSSGSQEPSPHGEPPEYMEDPDYGAAPPYISPVRARGEGVPRLPSVRVDTRLPAIAIIGSTPGATPAVGSPRGGRG